MSNSKISALTSATTPLAGTEVLPIVQSGATVKVANNDLRPKQIQSNATSGVLQVAGPSAASTRVMTTPDANFTAARTDAAQSFTGDQTLSTGNAVIGTSGKGLTTGSSIPLGLGTNGSTTQASIDTSGNFFSASASGTTRNGNFSNGGQLAALASNSTVRSFNSIYRYSATNNATVDVWYGRDAAGNVFGNSILVGHFYVYVNGASGANGFAGVYAIQTTGDGTSAATLTTVSSVSRGTNPVSSVQIANDGTSGAIKLTITYINNSGVVTGGGSTVTFFGQIA